MIKLLINYLSDYYELFDSYFDLRKSTTLYSKKQLLWFKKDFGRHFSRSRFSQASAGDMPRTSAARAIQFRDWQLRFRQFP